MAVSVIIKGFKIQSLENFSMSLSNFTQIHQEIMSDEKNLALKFSSSTSTSSVSTYRVMKK